MDKVHEINRKLSRQMTEQVNSQVEAILRATPGLDISAAEAINRLHARIYELETKLKHARSNTMEQHKWKPGDRFVGEVKYVDEDGDIVLGPDGNHSFQRYIHPDAVTPIPDHSEWVGRPIRELPAGTRFDLYTGCYVIRVMWTGEEVRVCTPQDMPGRVFEWDDDCTVVRIHKLGEGRPKTLGDEKPYVAWKSPIGIIYWKTDRGLLCYTDKGEAPRLDYRRGEAIQASERQIHPDWTRLGPIEGIKIGGVIYGEKQ